MSTIKGLSYLTSVLLLMPVLATAGTLSSMTKDEVLATFSEKTISTISAATLDSTVISDSFTGYFSKDGKMMGKFATKPANEPQEDKGTWRVDTSGTLCYSWDHWNGNKEKCAALYKLENGLLVINGQNGFESFILSKDIKPGNLLTR